MRQTERELLRNYKIALDDIRGKLALLYERYSVNGELTFAEMSKFNRMASLEKQIVEIMSPALKANAKLAERLKLVEYEESFYRTAWAIDQHTGVALRWGLLSPDQIREAVANPLEYLAERGVKEKTLLRVRREITQGLIRGDSYPHMMRGVKAAINESAASSMRIVRTEGQRAAVMGQQAQYSKAEDLGVDVVEVWDATLDDRTRPSHGALDGKEKDKEAGGWHTSIGLVAGPLQSGDPAFDIHCRCTVRPEVKGFEPKGRRPKEIGEYETFEKWAKRTGLAKNRYGQRVA